MKKIKQALLILSLSIGIICSCGIYSFSGSTLPAHLKTVDIPLFVNQTLQSGIAEDLTGEIAKEVLTSNLLHVVSRNGDASINGKVVSYTNQPYTYGNKGVRDVNVSSYAVRISVEVEFIDNKSNEPLYKGTVNGQGIYDFSTEQETDGRTRAIHDIVQQIIQNSVKSW
ncbi:MAG: LptE family protein [Chitinivibrionales bacterium]|nr:LptE family protein [Chitinivibrionales bacterium]